MRKPPLLTLKKLRSLRTEWDACPRAVAGEKQRKKKRKEKEDKMSKETKGHHRATKEAEEETSKDEEDGKNDKRGTYALQREVYSPRRTRPKGQKKTRVLVVAVSD